MRFCLAARRGKPGLRLGLARVLACYGLLGLCLPAWAQSTDLHLTNTTHSSGTTLYQATSSITADTGFVVNGTANVTFKAGTTIRLDPGFQATATSGGAFHALIGQPDFTVAFTLSLSSATAVLLPGASATYAVTVTGANGFNGTVPLTVSGLPSGASASFSPATITGSGSTTLTVSTTAATLAGAYTLTIAGVSGTASHSVAATLYVANLATMSSPTAGSTLSASTTFSWTTGGPGTTAYWLQVGTTAGDGDIYAGQTTATSQTVLNLPTGGQTLYVRLWTQLNNNWGNYYIDYTYIAPPTVPEQVPTVVSVTPSDGSGLSQTFVTAYSDANGASDIYYTFFVIIPHDNDISAGTCYMVYDVKQQLLYLGSTGTALAGPAHATTSESLTIADRCTVSGLGAGHTANGNDLTVSFPMTFSLAWSGRKDITMSAQDHIGLAINFTATGDDALGHWTIGDVAPGIPVLSSPANGSTGQGSTVTLSWQAAARTTGYDIYLGTSTPPPYLSGTTGTSYTVTGLTPGVKYYWYVVARNASASSASALWSFGGTGGTVLPTVSSVTVSSNSVTSATSITVTVALTTATASAAAITAVSSANGVLPSCTVLIAAATSSGSCTTLAGPVTTATAVSLTATYNGGSASASVTVRPSGTTTTTTITTSPSGMPMIVDGVVRTSPWTVYWVPDSTHTIEVIDPIVRFGEPETQYTFSSWSDGGSRSHSVVAPSTAITYTASYVTQYYLTTAANPSSGGTISPASGWVNSGTSVQVTASANSGYTFAGFSGALTTAATTGTVAMTAPRSLTGTFTTTSGQADFAIDLSSKSLDLAAGSTVDSTVTVTALNGFARNVVLSVSGLPTGVTASFSRGTVAGAGSSVLTLSADTATTLTASFSITITGVNTETSGTITHSTAATLDTWGPPRGTLSVTANTSSDVRWSRRFTMSYVNPSIPLSASSGTVRFLATGEKQLELLINTGLSTATACYVRAHVTTKAPSGLVATWLNLMDDSGNGFASAAVDGQLTTELAAGTVTTTTQAGGPQLFGNSQCALLVSTSLSSITSNGNTTTLSFSVALHSSFIAAAPLKAYARIREILYLPRATDWSDWTQVDTWTPTTTALSPVELQINLGPIPIDLYSSWNWDPKWGGPLIPDCPTGRLPSGKYWTVQDCIARLFIDDATDPRYTPLNYKRQGGVKGVRFFFGLGDQGGTCPSGMYCGPSTDELGNEKTKFLTEDGSAASACTFGTGGYYSNPFTASKSVNTCWLGQLKQLFTDLKSYGIHQISPTMAADNWAQGDTDYAWIRPATKVGALIAGCYLKFVPWLPYGFVDKDQSPGIEACVNADNQIDGTSNAYAYAQAAANPVFTTWNIYLNDPCLNPASPPGLYHEVLRVASDVDWGTRQATCGTRTNQGQFTVSDLDLVNEINLLNTTVQARWLYDTRTEQRDVLTGFQTLMQKFGFDPGHVTYSTTVSNPILTLPSASYYGDCRSGFKNTAAAADSAMLLNTSLLQSALIGGPIGRPEQAPADLLLSGETRLTCGGTFDNNPAVYRGAWSAPTITNIHNKICVDSRVSGDKMACNPDNQTELQQTATTLFDDVWSFLVNNGLTGNYMMFGETLLSHCESYPATEVPANAPAQQDDSVARATIDGYFGSTLAAHGLQTVFRTWMNVQNVCYPMPHYLGIYTPFRP